MSQGPTAGVNARPTIQGKREAEPGTAGRRSCAAARQRARCGAGDFARRKPVCRRKLPRRAFTPAGKICAPPEGYWHGKVPHPSVAWGDTSPCRGGGCAARRRRRGALPVCGGGILQGPAGPCPTSVGDDAGIVPEPLRYRKAPGGGRERPPYKTAASGQQRTNASHPPGPLAGRCKHRPLRRGAAGCRSRFRCPVYVTWQGGRFRPPQTRPPPPTSPAGVNARPTRHGKQEAEPGTAGIGPGKHRASPCQNAPALPPFCAAAHFYGILKVRTCQKYLYPI